MLLVIIYNHAVRHKYLRARTRARTHAGTHTHTHDKPARRPTTVSPSSGSRPRKTGESSRNVIGKEVYMNEQ